MSQGQSSPGGQGTAVGADMPDMPHQPKRPVSRDPLSVEILKQIPFPSTLASILRKEQETARPQTRQGYMQAKINWTPFIVSLRHT